MNWTNLSVLVTGAGGFIGSHLVERLVHKGATVRAFVRYRSNGGLGLLHQLPEDVLASIEVMSGDLCDCDTVASAVRGIDTILHLGAFISIPYSYTAYRDVVSTNVMGTLNVLSAAAEASVRRIVHTSSSEVYGSALYTPIDETHPLQGQSPYAASKIAADKLAESFYCSFNLPVITARPFNTYGPRQSTRAVIPTIITQALENDRIRLGDLRTARDFVYVGDTVEGFLRCASVADLEGQTINVGTGRSVTIGQLVRLIARLLDKDIEILQDSQRMRPDKSEVQCLLADTAKTVDLLSWRPDTDLTEGLRATISWFSENQTEHQLGGYRI